MTMHLTSRRAHLQYAIGATLAAVGSQWVALAASYTLPIASALDEDLASTVKQGKPLVVMVSLDGCPFCRVVRENFLPSLQREQHLTVVQVDMRKPTAIKDLQGRRTTHDQLTRMWGIKVAPTLLFFGKNGGEVADRLVGASVPDFYGAYLQERVDKALLSFV
ncbi:MAG: thioredoxin fold domain-containing protein [Polaromonas sp.]